MVEDLFSLFSTLSLPQAGDFAVLPSSLWPGVLVGRTGEGYGVLFLAQSSTSGGVPQPVHLQYITAQVGVPCKLVVDGLEQTGFYSIITCQSSGVPLLRTFFRVAAALLADTPSGDLDVSSAIRLLVDLLASAHTPSFEEVLGTWGELFVLVHATDPHVALKAWHVNPLERYDFSDGAERVEVKTTLGAVRKHHFSLEQLNPSGSTVAIASLCTASSTGGSGLSALAALARERLPSEEHALLATKILASLGDDWEAYEERFDTELARATLRFYDTTSIPSPEYPTPAGVSAVVFMSDLTSSTPLEAPLGSLATALWPAED